MGPTITPTPHMAMADPCSSFGWVSSRTACESGTRLAPNTPCSRRKTTIWLRLWAAPHIIEARVKPTTDHMKTRLRPKRAVTKPVSGMKIAAATMYEVRTQEI